MMVQAVRKKERTGETAWRQVFIASVFAEVEDCRQATLSIRVLNKAARQKGGVIGRIGAAPGRRLCSLGKQSEQSTSGRPRPQPSSVDLAVVARRRRRRSLPGQPHCKPDLLDLIFFLF